MLSDFYIERYLMNSIEPTWGKHFSNGRVWHFAVIAVGIILRQTDDRNIMVFNRHRTDAVEEEFELWKKWNNSCINSVSCWSHIIWQIAIGFGYDVLPFKPLFEPVLIYHQWRRSYGIRPMARLLEIHNTLPNKMCLKIRHLKLQPLLPGPNS